IGNDANRYTTWPRITYQAGDKTYLTRPWGESLVQKMFNAREETYEIIDNLAPESVSVKYLKADRGKLGSAADMARFVAFNLFETSFAQKLQGAGRGDAPDTTADRWNLNIAREELGHQLFRYSLDADDPLRQEMEANDPAAQALKSELDRLAGDRTLLSDS